MVVAAFLFATMGAAVKAASESLTSEVVVFFRNAFGLLVLLPLWGSGQTEGMEFKVLRLHLLRSFSGLAAMYCYFYTLAHLSLADAVVLSYTLPLFVPLIALGWLKEKVSSASWKGVGLGFVGIIFILKPGATIFDPIALIGVASGILGATAQVAIRRLTRTEPVTRIVFLFALVATVVSAVPMLHVEFALTVEILALLLLIGVLATAAQLLLTRGYASAPAARVGPWIYASVVFAALIDWGFWSYTPNLLSMVGAVLVCIGGILAGWSKQGTTTFKKKAR